MILMKLMIVIHSKILLINVRAIFELSISCSYRVVVARRGRYKCFMFQDRTGIRFKMTQHESMEYSFKGYFNEQLKA